MSKVFYHAKQVYDPREESPVIISVALTGNMCVNDIAHSHFGRPTKQMAPALPLSPEEIAVDAIKCTKAGASVVHIHCRDKEGKPTMDIEVFREIVRRIHEEAAKEEIELPIIQLSTGQRAGSAVGPAGYPSRLNPVRLLPEQATYCCGSLNLARAVYEASPEFLKMQGATFLEADVAPCVEIFEMGHLHTGILMYEKGQLKNPYWGFALGSSGGAPATMEQLSAYINAVPKGTRWQAAGLGPSNMYVAMLTMAAGGDVRIGLEDYIKDPSGNTVSNLQLVESVVDMAKMLGRPVTTPNQARKLLNLSDTAKDRVKEWWAEEAPLFPVSWDK